jgi:hypothetical protein
MSYVIAYHKGAAEDLRALTDMRDYVGEEKWATLGEMFFGSGVRPATPRDWLQTIDFALEFSEVKGRPVRAFKRAFLSAHGCWGRVSPGDKCRGNVVGISASAKKGKS